MDDDEMLKKSSQSFFSTLVDCVVHRSVHVLYKLQCIVPELQGHPDDDAKVDVIPLTGSVAEFYIEQNQPMLSHIGNVDVMFHFSEEMAIPRGHPPPAQLPDEFYSSVVVYEIIGSHLRVLRATLVIDRMHG